MLLEILAFACFIKIAIYDIKTHLIKNFDLIILGVFLIPLYFMNWKIGCLGLGIYLFINLLSRASIGYGDIKLSFLCSIPLSTINQLSNALMWTWICAGIFALAQPRRSMPFAPFMICGTYFAKIPLL